MRRTPFVLAAIFLIALAAALFRSTTGGSIARTDSTSPRAADTPAAPELSGVPTADFGDESPHAIRDAIAGETPAAGEVESRIRRLTVHVIDAVTSLPCPKLNVEVVELRLAEGLISKQAGQPPAYLESGSRRRETDESGNAVFEEVGVGRIAVRCSGIAAASERREFDSTGAAEQTIELRAWRTAAIRGLVFDDRGAPVAGAWIGATPVLPGDKRTSGNYSRSDGKFRIPVALCDDGTRGIRMLVRASSDSWLDEPSVEIDVCAGDNELQAPLVFRTLASSLSGRIVDALGAPLRRETISCQPLLTPSANAIESSSDDEGRFEFDHLTAGRFTLRCDSICLAATAPIEVAAGSVVDIGDLKAPAQRFDVEGMALFGDGKPAVGATVYLGANYVNIGGDGTFNFPRCSAEPVSLMFRWNEVDQNLHWRQIVRNVVPGSAPLRVVLIPRGALFRLLDSKTRAIVDARQVEVFAFDPTGQGASHSFTTTRGDLHFDLDGMEPPITLRFVVQGYRAYETKYEPPKGGYEDRHVIEIPLEKP